MIRNRNEQLFDEMLETINSSQAPEGLKRNGVTGIRYVKGRQMDVYNNQEGTKWWQLRTYAVGGGVKYLEINLRAEANPGQWNLLIEGFQLREAKSGREIRTGVEMMVVQTSEMNSRGVGEVFDYSTEKPGWYFIGTSSGWESRNDLERRLREAGAKLINRKDLPEVIDVGKTVMGIWNTFCSGSFEVPELKAR